ncbi:dimethyl sulfoxide reductase anchor subunit family protein [Senegalimassilia anaerobia]|uniref:dimethyl sulfoxide reductase anchor subunit family protein n=1 Tax=Senegalimassilia anaerobia TaxID=1473216 RepID=UPI002677245A|nr:DmsC/YnfH family molybdoenzyme membrane anchor subunit [Senegalimassilia anaerobia]MEE0145192.1 DmsC/YnfH family molybdoenzyme membrane anchor subunit [Senegalimassilia anaerobia]MEE0227029.1 DmsC/YnfH family molybdoenzyme membrane anchor subunit [Senegalimassilia anaerobia]
MMAELPLALFTTLAPIGAGAFIALAVAFFTTKFSDEQLKKIDRMTTIPVVVLVAGFICAFFHLASPMHAFGVFAGLGASPLSNELLAGVVFAVLAIVYWIVALAGKLGEGARKGFAAVVAVMAVVFACFTGAAYMMETIASWNTPMVPVAVLGFSLLGGVSLGVLVLALSGALEDAAKGGFKMAAPVVLVVGLVLGIAGLLVQVMSVSGMGNALVDGADLVAAASAPMWIGVVCMVVAAAAAFMALRNSKSTALAVAAPVLAIVGVFAARLAFYAVQLSVGLYIG